VTPYRDITDEEWQRVVPLLPELRPRAELRGRPLANTRSVLNGVLWVMYSGGAWSAMPHKYPSYQMCHRSFKGWYESGLLKRVMDQLFGTASDELCAMMQARPAAEAKAQRLHADPVAPAAADAFGTQPSQPAAPQGFDYTTPFRHAA